MGSAERSVPSSVLIIGSGVFGLSTAYSLAQRNECKNTTITVLERCDFPAPDAASIDVSRVIRADYPDYAYACLMAEGQQHWRGDFGADGRYSECGLVIVGDDPGTGNGQSREEFIKATLANIQRLGMKLGKKGEGDVTVLQGREQIKDVMGSMGGVCGSRGYVNWRSGWADAEEGMRHLHRLVEQTRRVTFRTAEVSRLRFSKDKVESVELTSGERLTADLIVLATGAWTPKFIDTRGICSATGQVLAYIDLTQEEQDRLETNPVILNGSNGMCIIPPRHRVLKVLRHGYGYSNPTRIQHPEISGDEIEVSLPRTKQDDPTLTIAPEGERACRDFLRQCIPDLAERPWTHTRICWYTDTPKGDWLISYHPTYSNLFVATGGSGHGYKFLPVIGERIVDIMMREPRDELGRELAGKWAWPEKRQKEDQVWTDDWRAGVKGMVLDDELAKK